MLNNYHVSDFVISGLLLTFLTWYPKHLAKRGDFKGLPKWFVPSLIGYHVIISGISLFYVSKFGGDSSAFWDLTADTSQNAREWTDYWGRNTFFIQWLNYFPAKILKLNYLTGCLIYSSLSTLGFVWLISLCKPIYLMAIQHSYFFSVVYLLLFFLPGPHFWTGIVGKEALIWFFMMLAFREMKSGRFLLFALGIVILIWIRPLVGIFWVGMISVYLIFDRSISPGMRNGILIFSLIGIILSLGSLSYMMHLEDFSLSTIRKFSENQYDFLGKFKPNTLISMEDYTYFYRLLTVGFRPLPGGIPTFWGFFAGLENLILIVLSIGLFPALYYSYGKIRLFLPLMVFIVGIGIFFLSIGLSVNVLGVMIRLKSSVIPLMTIFGWFGWFLLFHQRRYSKLI